MPNISDRYLDIKLPWDIDSVRRAEISKRVESALKDKWSAMANVRKLLSEIRPRLDQESEVDDLVEGGDDSLGL
jgi:uncharacterized membrane protein